MRYILLLLSVLTFPFFEHGFRSLGLFSLFSAVVLILHGQVGFKSLSIWVTLVSLILDVTFHQFFGTHLLSITITLVLYDLLERIVPSDTVFTKSIILSLSFLIYSFVNYTAVAISSGEGFFLSSNLLLSFLVKAIIGTIFCNIVVAIIGYTRTDSSSTLRLR